MTTRVASALLAVLLTGACAADPGSLDAAAEGYVRAALRLAQHDPDLVEAWRGPAGWRPGPRRPVADVLAEITRLQERVAAAGVGGSSPTEQARIRYLAGQLRGLRFTAERQLGRATSIDDQAREEFALTIPTLDRAPIDRAIGTLNRLLPGAAPLKQRVAELRLRTRVPRDRYHAVMTAALAACRAATAAALALPQEESVRAIFRGGLGWDAYARYAGGGRTDLEINDDAPLDVSRAFRLACHEGYPGHHVQHLLLDRLAGENHWPELLLTPGFGRHLLLAEGAAEAGADVALSPAAKAALYRQEIFPAAGLDASAAGTLVAVEEQLVALLPVVTDVARQYLDGALTQDRAIERLADEALVANPGGTLAFIERRRARALVYGEGRRVVLGLMPTRDLAGLRAAFNAPAALQ